MKIGEADDKNYDRAHRLLVVSFCGSASFAEIEKRLRTDTWRSGMDVWEILPSPAQAKRSIAFGANILESTTGKILANGNFAVLNEDEYVEQWRGNTRFICFLQTPIENDIGSDPFLEDIAWQWTLDALADAHHIALSGMVSRCTAKYFGEIDHMGSKSGIELRISWTPQTEDILPHANAFLNALENLSGLDPSDRFDRSCSASR